MSQEITDAPLVQRIQAGETEAMSILYRRHRPAIHRYALSKVYNHQVAQDITGEIFLRVVSYLPRYKVTAVPFTAWLFRIAHNYIITHGKRESIFQKIPLSDVDIPQAESENPALMVEFQLKKEWIWAGLDQIEENQRDVIIMRFINGLSLKETAHALEKSVGAVKTLQHRGIRALRVALQLHSQGVS